MKPNLPKRVKEKNKINSLALDLLQACVCWDPNSHFHNFVESLVTFSFPSWTGNYDKWGPSTCHNRVTLFRSGPHFLSLAGFLKSINSSRSTRHSPEPPHLSSEAPSADLLGFRPKPAGHREESQRHRRRSQRDLFQVYLLLRRFRLQNRLRIPRFSDVLSDLVHLLLRRSDDLFENAGFKISKQICGV